MSLLAPPLTSENYLDILELQNSTSTNITFFKNLLSKAEKKLSDAFLNHKAEAIDLVRIRAWYVEQIILQLWKITVNHKKTSLIAVGGFGRGDLHPYSDIDLLILHPQKTHKLEDKIRLFIQNLWDIGLNVGSSVRSPRQCYDYARKDATVATNLMEGRLITGNQKAYRKMQKLVSPKKIWKGSDFFSAKWKEQKLRHKKYSDTTYNVEPNIKEGPGGLRDIQMVSWVVQRFFQTNSLHELVDNHFLTEYEYIKLMNGQNFLWKVRFALHIIAGRKEERILFDYQLKLAKIFGFHDEGIKNPAVEQFMQIYYRNAMQLERLNLLLLQLFEEKILMAHQQEETKQINNHFRTINNFIEITDTQLFESTPTVWFELFLIMQQNPDIQGIRADTIRAIRHNINGIDESFRKNPSVNRQFIHILQQDKRVAYVLNQLNRLGILARYLPVFGRIVGRMQFDLFHIYTVDQHSLFAVRNLCILRHRPSEIKHANEIFAEIPEPYLLYIAALFHDIAKGREGHHSVLGAVDAREFCKQHDIHQEGTELIVWLVENHLLMSETAQKRDLNDEKIIEDFAKQVENLDRLRSLYLLTIADISATDPKLLNTFKQALLYELFFKTRQNLTSNIPEIEVSEIRKALMHQLMEDGVNQKQIQYQFDNFPEDLYTRHSNKTLYHIHRTIATQPAPVVSTLKHNKKETEFLIYCNDFKGLFYLMLSVMEKYNYTVVDANISNTRDGKALNTVHCLTDNKNRDSQSLQLVIEELKKVLRKEKFQEIKIHRFMPERQKVFKIKPEFKIHESNNDNDSLIEVICRDRHGLLPLIAKILLSLDISINAAKIVKVGARAEFTSWLSIDDKKLNNSQLKELENKLLDEL